MKRLWLALRSLAPRGQADPAPPPPSPSPQIQSGLSAEEAATWYRETTVAKAKALALADGVYAIVFYNLQHRNDPQDLIDPFELFEAESREAVQEWIDRTERLLATNYDVGDALVSKSHNVGDALVDKSARYESLRAEYIAQNPGFASDTYEHAIHLGAGKAIH